jgi:hypothetical protein
MKIFWYFLEIRRDPDVRLTYGCAAGIAILERAKLARKIVVLDRRQRGWFGCWRSALKLNGLSRSRWILGRRDEAKARQPETE